MCLVNGDNELNIIDFFVIRGYHFDLILLMSIEISKRKIKDEQMEKYTVMKLKINHVDIKISNTLRKLQLNKLQNCFAFRFPNHKLLTHDCV